MLTDIAIKSLKPKEKIYKVADRDGLYVAVTPAGSKIFRYDYRVNGRRETLTIGRYGRYGISLAVARERLIDAKKQVDEGISPAKEKKRAKGKPKQKGPSESLLSAGSLRARCRTRPATCVVTSSIVT